VELAASDLTTKPASYIIILKIPGILEDYLISLKKQKTQGSILET
jgi:hypothetical protein